MGEVSSEHIICYQNLPEAVWLMQDSDFRLLWLNMREDPWAVWFLTESLGDPQPFSSPGLVGQSLCSEPPQLIL